ncbi:MAG: TOMM precursor leader peptide-binding protein [Rhodocyclaceae bacterium]|nr:TOMM precursor leader peptide-binding protein [Rhodocyclaceae bacterium]
MALIHNDLGDNEAPPAVLALNPMYVIPEADALVLHTAKLTLRIAGRSAELFQAVQPLLDGSRTRDQVLVELGLAGEAEEVGRFLDQLLARGLATDRHIFPPSFTREEALAFSSVARYYARTGDSTAALNALRSARVVVAHDGPMTANLLRGLLQAGIGRLTIVGDARVTAGDYQRSPWVAWNDIGRPWAEVFAAQDGHSRPGTQIDYGGPLPVETAGWKQVLTGSDTAVCVISGPVRFRDWMRKFNLAALDLGLPWLTVAALDDYEVSVGPYVQPKATACYSCLEYRLKGNMNGLASAKRLEDFLETGAAHEDFGYFGPLADIAAGVAVQEICDVLVPDRLARTMGQIMLFDVSEYKFQSHAVLKLPRCPACGHTNQDLLPQLWVTCT